MRLATHDLIQLSSELFSCPVHIFPFGRFSFNTMIFVNSCPRISQTSVHVDVPMILNKLFLHHIHISMRRPSYINVSVEHKECFFFRHVELNSKFNVVTIKMKSPCIAQKFFSGFSVIFQFLSVETLPLRLEVLH